MKVKRKRRRLSQEFKVSAVEAMTERSHEELAAELGVHPSLLYKWVGRGQIVQTTKPTH